MLRWVFSLAVLSGCDYVVALERPADAAIEPQLDAPPVEHCPTGYVIVLPEQASRYRTTVENAGFHAQRADCADDAPGRTHLVTLEARAEAIALQGALGQLGRGATFWVGLQQASGATLPGDGWTWLTGAPLAMPDVWQTGEPDDGIDGNTRAEYGVQDHAALDVTTVANFIEDRYHGLAFPGVCECDGQPDVADVAL